MYLFRWGLISVNLGVLGMKKVGDPLQSGICLTFSAVGFCLLFSLLLFELHVPVVHDGTGQLVDAVLLFLSEAQHVKGTL